MSNGMLIPTHRLPWINLDRVDLLAGGQRRDGQARGIPIRYRAIGGFLATFPHPSHLQRTYRHRNLADSHIHMLGVVGPVLQRSPNDSLGAKSIDYSAWAASQPCTQNAMIRLPPSTPSPFLQFSTEQSPKIS